MKLAAALLLAATTMPAQDHVTVAEGTLEAPPAVQGVRAFKGIPFAQPPVAALRWREPLPPQPWTGVRAAHKFGPRCMQAPLFGDMIFRSDGMGEDCLYLNVWTPAASPKQKLPVLVYFFGGGFMAGDASEGRYDGESMARRGIVTVTVNYRLGVFGFLAHPELTAESPHKASGNYGLLDQAAALQWVHQNIAAFGGDPRKITIAGESAGSISVSAQMASPLAKDLIRAAIGESGSLLGTLSPVPLAQAEAAGAKFGPSLSALRALPAEKLVEMTMKGPRFPLAIDGHFLPESPLKIFNEGRQARVPLLAGWNSEEQGARGVLRAMAPTPANYAKAVKALYPNDAEEALKLYPGTTPDEVTASATALAGDRFIAFSTWKWIDLQAKTSGKPVYRYYYTRPRGPKATGAVHSAEIEYALGNLHYNKAYEWTPEDHKVSATLQAAFETFIKTAKAPWPAYNKKEHPVQVIDVEPKTVPEQNRARYQFLDRQFQAPRIE